MRTGFYHLRSPDWPALVALLDGVCRHKGLLIRSGQPGYAQLGRACGIDGSTFNQWRLQQLRPSRASLVKVAAYAGQPLGPWLEAAGLDAAAGEGVD